MITVFIHVAKINHYQYITDEIFSYLVDSKLLYNSNIILYALGNEAIDDWRNYMLHFNVNQWQKCVSHLKDNDTCGVDLRMEPQLHYSGNFWWSKSSHIKKLPTVEETLSCLSNRHKCEFWLNQIKGTYFSMWDSNISVYERHIHKYKKEKYINVYNTL